MNEHTSNSTNHNHFEKQLLQRGGNGGNGESNKATKRSVSETKKKFVASSQNWKCGNCNKQLNHTFEVDHKKRLEYGGTNEVSNLIALCRNCHGEKTAMENM
jgi:5-methylcytosine-specific restriction endonuclease McrA